MRRVWIFMCVVPVVLAATVGLAQPINVDWKLYGTTTFGGHGDHACFFDAKGIVKKSTGTIRVWTKCLLVKDLDNINIEDDFNGKIVENVARKVLAHYEPPIAVVQTIDMDHKLTVIQYEESANISDIFPSGRILYELKCSEKMLRELSMNFHIDGKTGSKDKPGEWTYTPPESNGDTLLQILCKKS